MGEASDDNSEKLTPDAISTEIKRKQKHNRPKKKRLRESILKQMEFYFSDAALSKDRYLGSLVKSDPYIPIEIFLKFNKIRELTQNVSDVTKALKKSNFLVLSEDGFKVRRSSPLLPYNADERTVYVESIPSTAGLSWLTAVFGKFGQIAYISLPKFQNSNRIKGFAFIEYKTANDAYNCLKTFSEMGCKLPTNLSPDELSSVRNFELPSEIPIQDKENSQIYQKKIVGPIKKMAESANLDKNKDNKKKPVKRCRKSESNDELCDQKDADPVSPIVKKHRSQSESDKEKKSADDSSKDQKLPDQKDKDVIEMRKGKHKLDSNIGSSVKKDKMKNLNDKIEYQEESEESEDKQHKKSKLPKMRKTRKESTKNNDKSDENDCKESNNEKEVDYQDQDEMKCESTKQETSDTDDNEPEKEKKRARNRSLKKRKKAKLHHEFLPEGSELGLQVLSKAEWKVLRNKYLNLQRKNYTEIKKTLRSKSTNPHCEIETSGQITEKEDVTISSQQKLSKYARKCPEKRPGIIVKANLLEPCLDVRGVKASTKCNIHVMHVDVKEGQNSMFVRFDEPIFATQFVESGIFKEAQVLCGQEEDLHWEKVNKEWESRANGGKRRMRGGDRLRMKVAQAVTQSEAAPSSTPASQAAGKHLRFDD